MIMGPMRQLESKDASDTDYEASGAVTIDFDLSHLTEASTRKAALERAFGTACM